jgi:hypothetical protein
MKSLLFLFLITFSFAASGQIRVESKNYKDKINDKIYAQTVALEMYKSPNGRTGQDKDQLVILAASGGGSRAASFSIGVFLELERILPHGNGGGNVLQEIDYFSTVSGGGWGTSSYLSFLHQRNKYDTTVSPYKTFNEFEIYLANWADRRYARYQTLYFFKDVFRLGARSSGDVMMDRLNTGYLGWGYRKSLEENLFHQTHPENRFSDDSVDPIRLSDVFTLKEDDKLPILPMVISNTTNLDNYFLVPFTPDRLLYWGVSQYTVTKTSGGHEYPVKATRALTKDEILQIPFASGINASSSVPGFIGTSYYKSEKDKEQYYLRLMDGGIVDNQGLHTVKAILKQEATITDKSKRIVFIIDASGVGLTTARPEKKHLRRKNSLIKIATTAAPDSQYPLMRERIQDLEKEYNCTVIYIGTEVLLNPKLGLAGQVPEKLVEKKSSAEKKFYETYRKILKDKEYYQKEITMEERSLLYEYIRSEIPTWFSARKSKNKGRILVEPAETTGSSKILFLAGRAVVQLKRAEIEAAFTNQRLQTKID